MKAKPLEGQSTQDLGLDYLMDTNSGIWCNNQYVFVAQHMGYYARILKGKRTK